jgi:aminopeptidase 2
MIWLTREAFDAIGDDVNRMAASKGAVGGWVNRLVAHEIAHQYWAHQLKMWSLEDQWLTESFAEFTSALAMRAMKNKGQATYEIIVKDWEARAKLATKAASIPTANFLYPNPKGDQEHFRYRQDLVYSKGAFLLACLHKELGEQKFVQFLRQYLKSFAWYPPSFSQDVPDLLKAVTGKDYQPWMDRYFYGTDMPEWKP